MSSGRGKRDYQNTGSSLSSYHAIYLTELNPYLNDTPKAVDGEGDAYLLDAFACQGYLYIIMTHELHFVHNGRCHTERNEATTGTGCRNHLVDAAGVER